MISTKNLDSLPDIDTLRRACQSIAMLDAIICPEWQFRYYSFNARWGNGEMMASMRNGSGDEYCIHFTKQGAVILGFAHESEMSPFGREERRIWPGVLDQLPEAFSPSLTEALSFLADITTDSGAKVAGVTFCIWRNGGELKWNIGHVDFPSDHFGDGSKDLLINLDGKPETYKEWADGYYRSGEEMARLFDMTAIEHVFRHKPLTMEVVARLNPDVSLADVAKDMEEIGYPGPPR